MSEIFIQTPSLALFFSIQYNIVVPQWRHVVPLGTILARKRKDGTTGYTAQIVRKQNGKIVHREAKTFNREREARAWAAWREAELDKPGALEQLQKPSLTLGDAIDRYTAEKRTIGRTKEQVLRSIKKHQIATMESAAIKSADIVRFADELADGGLQPQTVGNYVSHLAAIFRIAKPAWGIELSYAEMQAAQAVLARLGKIGKSKKRERRPTLEELDELLAHFVERQVRVPQAMPMQKVIVFALFSTRRQEEITTIRWDDYEPEHSRVLVRDMKHPGQKIGNDTWVDLPPEAIRIIGTMPRKKPQIFPFTTDAISANFTRACALLGIEDLHFHDLRHEGVSRLFEMGWNIPHVAAVSGHRSWASLKRYTQIRSRGDKYTAWPWLDRLAPVKSSEQN